jgi:5'-AMP-activated protein kinase catalytic alpha subunit
MNDTNLIPGIIIGYNLIPVDENILNLCVAYNSDRDKIEYSVRNNRYDEGSALYYLLVRKITKKGFESISDLSSDLFIDFILDDNNLVHPRRDKRRQKNNSVQMNRNNSKSLNKSNNTIENNYRNNLTPSTLNNKDISSSNRHIDDLGAAPRLIPPMNNNKIDKFKGKKDNLLEKKKKKNKVNSVSKNSQYPGQNNDELSKKNIFPGEKNKLKNKNMTMNKNNNNNNDNFKKRFNNSAQHRQNNNKNTNKIDNNVNISSKLKTKKINEKNANNNNKNNSTINKENDNSNNSDNIVK